MIATSHTVCRGLRRGISNRFLNRIDRASELDTAAATPSSISSVIRISLESTGCTPLLYASAPFPHRTRQLGNLMVVNIETYNEIMPFASVKKVAEADFPTRWGRFRILGFEGL